MWGVTTEGAGRMDVTRALVEERIDYAARLAENIGWLRSVRGWSMKRAAGLADVGLATLKKWLNGSSSPTVSKLDEVAAVLGCHAEDLLLPLEELQFKYGEKGEHLRPLVLAPANRGASTSSSDPSRQTRTRFAAKTPSRGRSGKTGTGDASSRCFGWTDDDQRRCRPPSREVASSGGIRSQALRAVRTPVLVPETDVQGTKAA
jgi:transcriptional regulator with XRE-family HTH domain